MSIENQNKLFSCKLMDSIKYICILFLSLAMPILSSCSNDDEDELSIGGINLVGTWALIHSNGDKIESFYQYIVKPDGTIISTSIIGECLDGYLWVGFPQYYIDDNVNRAEENPYQCTFRGNSVYYEDWEVAKITVIDSETVKMVSTTVGSGTLKKISRIVAKPNLTFHAGYPYNALVSLEGKWIGVETDENTDGSYDVRYRFEIDDYGTLSVRQFEGVYKYDGYRSMIISTLSQEELTNKLKEDATVFKYCQWEDNNIYFDNELLATINVVTNGEAKMESRRWGSLKLIRETDNLQFVSTQNFNYTFTPSTGGSPVSLVGTWVVWENNSSMTMPTYKRVFSLSSDGTLRMYSIEATYDNHTIKTSCTEDDYQYYQQAEYSSCQRIGNDLYYNDYILLSATCLDKDRFTIYWQQPPYYEEIMMIERVDNIVYAYDFNYSVNYGYTPDAPFSVWDAIAKCKEIGSTASENNFYVKGIISSINEVSLSYGNATFNISDNGDNASGNVLTAYHTRAIGGSRFVAENQIKVGDLVILCGKLVHYRNNAPELLQGYIYSMNSGSSSIDFGSHGDGTTR